MAAPQSSLLKARVPMARVEGTLAFITIEWLNILRALEQLIVTGGGSSSFDPTEILEQIAANTMSIGELQAQMTDLTARVVALEGRYER